MEADNWCSYLDTVFGVVNHHFLTLAKYITFLCVLTSQAYGQNIVEDREEMF